MDIFLINYWCGRVQPTVGSVLLGEVLLGGIRKQAWKHIALILELGKQKQADGFLLK